MGWLVLGVNVVGSASEFGHRGVGPVVCRAIFGGWGRVTADVLHREVDRWT